MRAVPQTLRKASSFLPTSARLQRVLCEPRSSFLTAQPQRHGPGADFLCSPLQDRSPGVLKIPLVFSILLSNPSFPKLEIDYSSL